MKMIVAIIRPDKLDAVISALDERDVHLMTVSDVRGCGRQRGFTETYRGAEYSVDFVPKVCVQVIVDDALAPSVISAIETAARTGSIGDGKIAVMPIEDVIRIRTGERGPEAI